MNGSSDFVNKIVRISDYWIIFTDSCGTCKCSEIRRFKSIRWAPFLRPPLENSQILCVKIQTLLKFDLMNADPRKEIIFAFFFRIRRFRQYDPTHFVTGFQAPRLFDADGRLCHFYVLQMLL